MPADVLPDMAINNPDETELKEKLAYPNLVAAGGKMPAATSQIEHEFP